MLLIHWVLHKLHVANLHSFLENYELSKVQSFIRKPLPCCVCV